MDIIICGTERKVAEKVAEAIEKRYGVKPEVVAPKDKDKE